MAINSEFIGTWKNFKDENFEAFLEANDVGFIKKKAATSLNPTITIHVDGETIKVTMKAGPKTVEASFKLGEDYKVEGPSGNGTANSTYDGSKIITVITPDDGKKPKQTVIRELIGGDLVQTMTSHAKDDVTCKRFFKKQPNK